MRPRPDGAEDLLGLGGGEDELDVRRRLLDDLQQGVEALRRDHVGLVDDVDLVARASAGAKTPVARAGRGRRRPRRCCAASISMTSTLPVRRGEVAAAAGTRRTGSGVGPCSQFRAPGEDARGGGLAAAARAGEQVGVVRRGRARAPAERLGDVLLPDQVGEALRAVAAVQGGRHGADPSPTQRRDSEGTPRAPARARLPLLPSGPGGVQRDDAARGVGRPVYAASRSRGCPDAAARGTVPSPAEDSPSGLGRTLGKRVGGNPSRVRIPYPPRLPSQRFGRLRRPG